MLRRNLTSNERGMTLHEMLFVVILLSVFVFMIFKFLEVNYRFVGNETKKVEQREEFTLFSTYLAEDLWTAKAVTVQHPAPDTDLLIYEDVDGNVITIRFKEGDGIYELRKGKETKIMNAKRWDDTKKMVEYTDGILTFNVYDEINNLSILLTIKPRYL